MKAELKLDGLLITWTRQRNWTKIIKTCFVGSTEPFQGDENNKHPCKPKTDALVFSHLWLLWAIKIKVGNRRFKALKMIVDYSLKLALVNYMINEWEALAVSFLHWETSAWRHVNPIYTKWWTENHRLLRTLSVTLSENIWAVTPRCSVRLLQSLSLQAG